jgi:putative DNA primase/helicase
MPSDYSGQYDERNEKGRYVSPDELLEQSGPEFLLRERPLPQVLPSPNMPMEVARKFYQGCCIEAGVPILVRWRGSWYRWKRARWVETSDDDVKHWLYRFAEKAKFTDKKGEQALWAPNRNKVANVHDALAALEEVCPVNDETERPCWTDKRETGIIVSCRNGLLDLEKRTLAPHTPRFFNATFVPFDYEPNAPKPEKWLAFLAALFPKNPKAIAALQEWFGYIISGRTDLQKILLTVGPKRGGKGLIARIERALIGPANYAGITLKDLGKTFGLESLLGKSLAVVPDVRFTEKNADAIIEWLLSISGEDPRDVPRKYKIAWHGRMPCRIHVITNALPALSDASQTIVDRLIIIPLTKSWLGKEDLTLASKLEKELTSIFNWSLEGLERLTKNGRFTHIPSAKEAIETMQELASPVAAFVREKCETGKGESIERNTLYEAYRKWCAYNGYPIPISHIFSRDLKAAFPAIKDKRPRKTGAPRDAPRNREYVGISVASECHEWPRGRASEWPRGRFGGGYEPD